MGNQYISARKKITDFLKPIFNNSDFQADKSFFIASICIELGAKRELVDNIIEEFKKVDIIKEEFGIIKNIKLYQQRFKSELDKEIDDDFKKAGI